MVFQYLFTEQALDQFAGEVNDEIWCYAHPVNVNICKMMNLVGERNGISTVNVAPHYYSWTRISNRFSEREVQGPERIALPDMFVVFEPRSKRNLKEQGIDSRKIVVARDKVEAEAGSIDNIYSNCYTRNFKKTPSVKSIRSEITRILVILHTPKENADLVEAVEKAAREISDIEVVFKPHPFFPPDDQLFDMFKSGDYKVTSPDTEFEKIIKKCDICISIYSTAAFPVLINAIPVVWVPFVGENFVFMDLLNDIGIRADEPDDLVNTLDRLIHDETVYNKQAQDCAEFAAEELVPEANSPSLASVLNDQER